jgi:hypothetical protein
MIKCDIKSLVNISLPREQSISIRGHPKSQVMPYITQYGRNLNTINNPIHSLTHICFPQSVETTDLSSYMRINQWKNVCLINCTDKNMLMKDHLQKYTIDDFFEKSIEYPYINYYYEKIEKGLSDDDISDKILQLIHGLEITYDYIISKANANELKKAEFILFYTDWSSFRYNSEVLSIHDEMSHAFLIHPYIDPRTISKIINKFPQIKGIGSDIPSLNNPLRYVNIYHSHPNVNKALQKANNLGLFPHLYDDVKEFYLNECLLSKKITPDSFKNITKNSVNNLFYKEEIVLPVNFDLHSKSYNEKVIVNLDNNQNVYKILSDNNMLYVFRSRKETRTIVLNLTFDLLIDNIIKEIPQYINGDLLIVPIPVISDNTGIVCESFYEIYQNFKKYFNNAVS